MVSGCNKPNDEKKVIDPASGIKFTASANVNGEPITSEEFNKKFLQVKIAVARTNNFKFNQHIVNLLGKETLEGMIEVKLIEKELERLKIKPSEENVNKFADIAKKAYKDEAKFKSELNSLQMTEEDFVESSRKQLYENTLRKYLADKVNLKDKQMELKVANELYLNTIEKLKRSAKIERKIKSE